MDAMSVTGTRQCCKALQFQLARLLEQQSADKRAKRINSDEQLQKIISLEDKIKSLEENLRVVQQEKMEIETNSTAAKHLLENHVAELQQTNAKLLARHKLANEEHRSVLEDFKEMYRAAIEKMTLQTNSDMSEMVASHDRKLTQTELINTKERERLVLEHEEEIRQHVTKLQCLEKESKEALMELSNSLNEKEATFHMDMKTIQSMYLKKNEESNEYQRVNKILKDKIKPLGDLLKEVTTLKFTLVVKNNLIKNKMEDIVTLKKEKTKLQRLLAEEQGSYLILKIRLDCELDKKLEDKLKEAQLKVLEKDDECKAYKDTITDLRSETIVLREKVPPLKASVVKERKRSDELKAYQQRFKAELVACLDLISQPSEFQKSMAALKRKYIDDNDLKVPKEDTRFEEQFLKVANNVRRKLVAGECHQVKVERSKYLKKCKDLHKEVRVINEQTVIIRTQRAQIRRMEQDLKTKGRCRKEAQGPSSVAPLAVRGTTGGGSAPLAAPPRPGERSTPEEPANQILPRTPAPSGPAQ
ncbi:uncharacterized protein LOC119197605 [Pungitius pungitius]|uniref:uncharacterized protein LOC119197605 n=1 Tax=Pungitius pungitius TaxID=134920 RepID=UPI002E100708